MLKRLWGLIVGVFKSPTPAVNPWPNLSEADKKLWLDHGQEQKKMMSGRPTDFGNFASQETEVRAAITYKPNDQLWNIVNRSQTDNRARMASFCLPNDVY